MQKGSRESRCRVRGSSGKAGRQGNRASKHGGDHVLGEWDGSCQNIGDSRV